jgi:hypothetical protein
MTFSHWLWSVQPARPRWSAKKTRRMLKTDSGRKLLLEQLEDRTLPSTAVTWIAGNGDWDTATNWSSGAVPGATDDVDINVGGVTITHNAATAHSVNSLKLEAGTLTGADALTVNGAFTWTGGTLSGSGSLTAGGLALNAPGNGLTLDGRGLVSTGTTTWAGGTIHLANGATFTNQGTFLDQTTGNGAYANFLGDGNPNEAFYNYGPYTKTGNNTGQGIGVPFYNTSTVVVQSGNISFGGGTSSGSFTGDPGTTLVFAGAATTFTSTASISGDTVDFNTVSTVACPYHANNTACGAATFSGPISSDNPSNIGVWTVGGGSAVFEPATPTTLTMASLTLNGGGGLGGSDSYVVSGTFTWSGGDDTLSGPAGSSLTAQGGLALNGPGSGLYLAGMNLVSSSTATWTGGTIHLANGATFTNQGTFLDQTTGNGAYTNFLGDGNPNEAFYNYGPYTKTGNNTGQGIGVPFYNTSTVVVQSGNLNLGSHYVQTAGSTALAGGSLGGELNIQGGVLTGSGTVSGDVYNTAGQVNPGGTGTPGILAINGTYTQSGSGALNIELGGAAAGNQFDQLNVSGNASLGGTLNISLLPNLGHVCGVSFAVVNGTPVSGTFSTINGLSQPGGMTITPTYSSGSVTLAASQFAATTGVTASVNPSILNQGVTFTATVSAPAGATESPTGTVQFQVDSANVGSAITLSSGQASLSLSSLTAGPHAITALYSGDSCFFNGSGSLTQNVHYTFGGFQAPLGQVQGIAINRNVPIKFQLSDFNSAAITTSTAVTALQINYQNVDILNGTGAAGVSVNGKTYTFTWQTKGLAAGSYTISLTLADGTTHTITVQLTKNGNSSGLTTTAAGGTSAALGGLLGGNVELYVDNTNGDLTADELARIQDAVTAADSVTEPYGVAVTEVTDPTLADVTLNMDTTSAVGGYADGVLGCTTDAGQITIINGWNFYAGSNATQIGSAQYDFETVVEHELGHALGLGHSTDSTSVMYATLNMGSVNRTLTTADLNVADSDTTGACGLHAAVSPTSVASNEPLLDAPGREAFFAMLAIPTHAPALATNTLAPSAYDAVFANPIGDIGTTKFAALSVPPIFGAPAKVEMADDSFSLSQEDGAGTPLSPSAPPTDRPDLQFDFIPADGAIVVDC